MFPAAFTADDSNVHGWNVTAVGNLTRRFGLEADFGGYGGNIDLRDLRFEGETFFVTDATFNTYLFGPRLSYRTDGRLTPFVHALLGAVTVKGAMLSNRSSLGFVLGGGLDIVATRHFAVRMIQADYVRTQLDSFAKDNLRISAGAVIRF
jgi:hypothetical protein